MKNYFSKREIALISIILLLLSIILYFSLVDTVVKNIDMANAVFTIFTAVICSILAAAIAPHNIQGTNINQDRLVQELENKIAIRMQTIINEKEFAIPSITYHDTDDPNVSFDKKLNESISVTKKYIYFSDRAFYLPKRLSKMIHTVDNRLCMTVILADIRDDSIYDARKDLYVQRERALHLKEPTYKIRSLDEIIRAEKIAVIKSIYALSKLMERYNINIYLHKEIPFLRFEITDSLLILTFLTQLTTGKTYPASVIYENEKLFRVNFEDYSNEVVKRSFHLEHRNMSIEGLKEIAKQAGINDITENDITDFYTKDVK